MRRSIFLSLTLLFSACNSGSASEPQTAISISEAKTTETVTTSTVEDSNTTISNLPSTTDTQEPSGSTQPSSESTNRVSVPAGPNPDGTCAINPIGSQEKPRIESIQISNGSVSNQDPFNIEVKVVDIAQIANVNIAIRAQPGAYLREMPWTKESSRNICGLTEQTFVFNKRFAPGTPSGQYEIKVTLDGTYSSNVDSSSQQISYTNSSPDVDYPELQNGSVSPQQISPGAQIAISGKITDATGLLMLDVVVLGNRTTPLPADPTRPPGANVLPGCRWVLLEAYKSYPSEIPFDLTCSAPSTLDPAFSSYYVAIYAYDKFGNWHQYRFDLPISG